MPTVNFGAENPFGLGEDWLLNSATPGGDEYAYAEARGAVGDIGWRNVFDKKNPYAASAEYNGADLGADTDLVLVGGVMNSKFLDSFSLAFAVGQAIKLSMTGHQHPVNPHTTPVTPGDLLGYLPALSDLLPASVVSGQVPGTLASTDFNATANASLTAVALNFSASHTDRPGNSGDHFVGSAYGGELEVSLTYIGVPTLPTTPAGWTLVGPLTKAETNSDFLTSTVKYKVTLARSVVS